MLARQVAVQPLEMIRSERRQEIQLVEVLRMLLRRRNTIFAVVAGVSGHRYFLQLGNSAAIKRAEVVIEPESQAAAPFQTGTEDSGTFDYFLTQLEILRSRTVAAEAMERLVSNSFPASYRQSIAKRSRAAASSVFHSCRLMPDSPHGS